MAKKRLKGGERVQRRLRRRWPWRRVEGDWTQSELSSQFEIHPNQILKWKAHLLEHLAELFEDGRKSRKDDTPDESELYEQIGRLKMELDWLKKICRNRL